MSRYPSEPEIQAIIDWSMYDMHGWFNYIEEIWAYPEAVNRTQDGKFTLSTGGWSGNEEIIGAMKQNTVLWMVTWEQSTRGGHFVFDLTRIPNE